MKGKVQTVLGPVDPEALGVVLPHEHLLADVSQLFYVPSERKQHIEKEAITLQNLGWIRQYPYSNLTNMQLIGADVEAELIRDLKNYKSLGGGTIVENTTLGIKSDMTIEKLKTISEETGVHIIAGTGYYVDAGQSPETKSLSEEKLSEVMVKELEDGIVGSGGIKCGILGEVGISWPITDFEKRSIRASAATEAITGCPVMFHPGRDSSAPEEIIRIFTEAGGNAARAVMGHLDRTIQNHDHLFDFASMGTYLEFDLFGIETSLYQQAISIDMPSDAQRISRVKHLIDNGLVDRVLISHDIHTKHRLGAFGGHGYCHILENVVPMMKKKGISENDIHKMTAINPAQWLTFIK